MFMLENAAVYAVISIPITVLISIFTYQLIEQPMNKVGAEMAKALREFLKFRPRVNAAHSNG
ncbi:hypothetical protein D3C84_1285180 [compost metagenome]